ncbi:hypothetical protein [Pseudoalteromonas phenolica]|uniref:hypothetical protein n=1 Tax=Pseudoalteromonas phenolica TaxID=161398 RepID=UPI00110A1517|nr:hypothetical protein [Pseudoalteromonas phenolica]
MLILELEKRTDTKHCIAVIENSDSKLCVYEAEDLRWLTFGDTVIQGVMSVSRPELLLSPVSQAFLMCFLQMKPSYSILNLGLGIGAIERAFHYLCDKQLINLSVMKSIELSPTVTECVQRFFHLPLSDIEIADALSYINTVTQQYDVILLDFCFDNADDDFLLQGDFLKQASNVLSESGELLFNYCPYSEAALVELLKLLKRDFISVTVVEFYDLKNIVIKASKSLGEVFDEAEFAMHPAIKALTEGREVSIKKIYLF